MWTRLILVENAQLFKSIVVFELKKKIVIKYVTNVLLFNIIYINLYNLLKWNHVLFQWHFNYLCVTSSKFLFAILQNSSSLLKKIYHLNFYLPHSKILLHFKKKMRLLILYKRCWVQILSKIKYIIYIIY